MSMKATPEQVEEMKQQLMLHDYSQDRNKTFDWKAYWWNIFHWSNSRMERTQARSVHYWYNLGFNDKTLWTLINAAAEQIRDEATAE